MVTSPEQEILDARARLGHKFGPRDLAGDLVRAAYAWLADYQGTFNWLKTKQAGVARGLNLTAPALAGVLNSAVYEAEQRAIRSRLAPTPALRPIPAAVKAQCLRDPELARVYDELFPDASDPVLNQPVTAPAKPDPALPASTLPQRLFTVDPKVSDGFYTVEFNDGHHVTIRVQEASEATREKLSLVKDAQLVGYLNGPENTADYVNFADKQGSQLRIWKKHVHLTDKVQAARKVLGSAEDRAMAGVKWAKASGKCFKCGRTLTTPRSVAEGQGPICAGRD